MARGRLAATVGAACRTPGAATFQSYCAGSGMLSFRRAESGARVKEPSMTCLLRAAAFAAALAFGLGAVMFARHIRALMAGIH